MCAESYSLRVVSLRGGTERGMGDHTTNFGSRNDADSPLYDPYAPCPTHMGTSFPTMSPWPYVFPWQGGCRAMRPSLSQ